MDTQTAGSTRRMKAEDVVVAEEAAAEDVQLHLELIMLRLQPQQQNIQIFLVLAKKHGQR
ncbi:hypothetical protein F2Q68_00016552 [Brassica cretica]|uniref:Uncharacterized protein n=1 Tax=Brassica cretica TaxID=69181 RepID=A0A8S9HC03_BRACR|nr:hypothetical protein F2Q68_00016552 [Brassica cretica]KAF3586557.1 hypothetical protein F2Q69_00030375 [Brassica cretica]